MKRRLVKVIPLIVLISCQYLFADYPSGGFTEQTMLGRRPNARMEAMGKTAVASSGFLYAAVVNPACIGEIDNISLSYSVDPKSYYLLKDDDWFSQYIGVGCKYKNISFAFDFYQQNQGTTSYWENENEIICDVKLDLYSINLAYELLDGLYIGNAIRIPRWDFRPQFDKSGLLFDLGVLKKNNLISGSNFSDNIDIGLSFSNILNKEIITNSTENAPQNLRFGFSNYLNLQNFFINQIITNLEVGHIFNSEYKDSAIRFGFETSFWDIVLVRCGYYYEQRGQAAGNSKDHLTDFTYGIGIKLPTNIFHIDNITPLDITFDFASMKQPTYKTNYDSWDNFYNFGITLDWNFNQLK